MLRLYPLRAYLIPYYALFTGGLEATLLLWAMYVIFKFAHEAGLEGFLFPFALPALVAKVLAIAELLITELYADYPTRLFTYAIAHALFRAFIAYVLWVYGQIPLFLLYLALILTPLDVVLAFVLVRFETFGLITCAALKYVVYLLALVGVIHGKVEALNAVPLVIAASTVGLAAFMYVYERMRARAYIK